MLEGRDRVSAGAALIDRGSDTGVNPDVVGGQAEGGHPFEDVDVQVDPARRHQLAVQVDHLTRLRRQANADRGDPVAVHRKVAAAKMSAGQYQVIGCSRIVSDHLTSALNYWSAFRPSPRTCGNDSSHRLTSEPIEKKADTHTGAGQNRYRRLWFRNRPSRPCRNRAASRASVSSRAFRPPSPRW